MEDGRRLIMQDEMKELRKKGKGRTEGGVEERTEERNKRGRAIMEEGLEEERNGK